LSQLVKLEPDFKLFVEDITMTHQPDSPAHGSSSDATHFMQILQQIEDSRDIAPMVALYTDESTLWKPSLQQPLEGVEGATKFWSEYLAPFARIHSSFNNVIENGEGDVVLEWVGEGELQRGGPIRYTGVSLVQMLEGKVKYFRTYYDSATFLMGKSVNEQQPSANNPALVSEVASGQLEE